MVKFLEFLKKYRDIIYATLTVVLVTVFVIICTSQCKK